MTGTPQTIVVIEDEPRIASVLASSLEREGYQVEILNEGSGAVAFIEARQPLFVILDLMLPGSDGLTICREVRRVSDVPIMVLSARADEIDRLIALELGADDYVCKPFSSREVVARVKAVLRRARRRPAMCQEQKLSYRGVTLFLDRYLCVVDGNEVELTRVEFRLLEGMMSHPGVVFSRDRLMDLAYTDQRNVSDRTIDTHIKNLRKKLSPVLGDRLPIQSIYGVGYKID